MKISVITVCYNSIATLQDTLESILRQTYPDVESIVVDGASKDETVNCPLSDDCMNFMYAEAAGSK